MNFHKILVAVCSSLLALAPLGFAKSEKKPPQVELVRKLYKAFAWEAVMPSEEGDVLIDQPKDVLKAYFDAALVDLLVADRECARKEGFCQLDKDPLFGFQDPIAHGLEVTQGDSTNTVRVQFSRIDGGKDFPVDLEFSMVQTKNGWRIADVVYEKGPSLKKLLTVEEEPVDDEDE